MISTTDHHYDRRKCDAIHLVVFPVPSKHLIDIWGERPWISDILESLDYNFYTKLWIVPKTKCSLSQMKKFSVAAFLIKLIKNLVFLLWKSRFCPHACLILNSPFSESRCLKKFHLDPFFEAWVLFSFVRWNWHDAAAASASTRRWWRLVDWGRVTPLSAPRPTTHLTKDDKKQQ